MKRLVATFALILASQSVFAANTAVNMNDPAMNPALKAKLVDADACNKRVGGSTNTRIIRANGTSAPTDSKSVARARSNASA